MESVPVQQEAEQLTLEEIQARLTEIDASEMDFSLDESELTALQVERERLTQRAIWMRKRKEQQDTEAYQARHKAAREVFLARRDTVMTEVNKHVTGLMLALQDVTPLVQDAHSVPWSESPGSVESVVGVPTNFAQTLLDAIRAAAPNTQWDFAAADPFNPKPGRPTLKAPQEIRLPRFYNGPPPGYTGTWDMVNDKALDDQTGMFLPFLPPAT